MAEKQTWLQRQLASLSAGWRAPDTGEAPRNVASRLGSSFRRATITLRKTLGITTGDAFEGSGPDRRRAAARLIGDEGYDFVEKDGLQGRDLQSTVEKKYRGQVASGLTQASSRAVGSSLYDAPGYDE